MLGEHVLRDCFGRCLGVARNSNRALIMNSHQSHRSESARLARKAANLRTIQLAIQPKHPDLAERIGLEASICEQRALMLLGYP